MSTNNEKFVRTILLEKVISYESHKGINGPWLSVKLPDGHSFGLFGDGIEAFIEKMFDFRLAKLCGNKLGQLNMIEFNKLTTFEILR